jgi:hypothetical protein
MLFLRRNPKHVAQEKSPFKNIYVNVHYDIDIKGVNPGEFKIPLVKQEESQQ